MLATLRNGVTLKTKWAKEEAHIGALELGRHERYQGNYSKAEKHTDMLTRTQGST